MTVPAPKALGNAAEGLIRFFTLHRTAHNLLMALLILAGLVALSQMRRQFLPDIDIPVITVSVAYPGATALQVDSGIVEQLEPSLRQVSNVTRVEATSRDGLAFINLEFPVSADIDVKLGEVQRVVAAASLPTDASDPSITQQRFRETVTHFVLSGPVRHEVLNAYAADLQSRIEREVDATVDLFGGPRLERRVELDPIALEAAGLSLEEVSGLITSSAREVSAGQIEGGGPNLQTGTIPTLPQEIEALPLHVRADGSVLRLGDVGVASVAQDPNITSLLYIAGEPAVDLDIIRSVTGNSIEIRNRAYAIVEEFSETLPAAIEIQEWGNSADLISSRIDLLVENGLWGLLIVMVLLFIFMGARSAFWVAAGIPVAILGTFVVMLGIGETVNMISLFAVLLSLGIIVDDAIVVAEHADALHREGASAQEAAMRGGIRMSGPVLASSLTTIGAFAPLFVISGEWGAFILAFPLVVIAVIAASLIECFLVLPGHMKSALTAREQDPEDVRPTTLWLALQWALRGFRVGFDARFAWFREAVFGPLVARAVAYRYVVLTIGLGVMAATYGLLTSGRVEQQFSPDVEFNNIFASFELSAAADLEDTVAFCAELDRSLKDALESLNGQDDLVLAACYTGVNFLQRGPVADQPTSTIASLAVEFTDGDEREFSNDDLLTAWRERIVRPANLQSLELDEPATGPAAQSLSLRIRGSNLSQLALAADALALAVSQIDGVSDLSSSFALGTETLSYETNTFGRALGFSDENIGRQMRAALTGTTVYSFIEQEDEVNVRLVLAEEDRGQGFQETYRVKSPSGSFATLTDVADAQAARGINRVRRVDGQVTVRLTGSLDSSATTLSDFRAQMQSPEIAALLAPFGAELVVGGQAEQEAQFFADLMLGAIIGLATIFIVLAWVFSSYTRPFVVLMVIPFGIVGAVVGHWLLDMPLAILSYISIFGLSGIVVNDSIVLISRVDERAEEQPIYEAIVGAAKDRLRAVILTSLTTIGGLLPLMFETSVQAQFLIPMAVTIVFGLGVSTILILLFVPALVGIQADIGLAWRLMFFSRQPLASDPHPDATG